MTSGGPDRGRVIYGLVTALFFVCIFLLLVSTNMQKELSHDEHMYVTAGELLVREGLLPYKDYPFLQMPGLPLAYAVIFQVTDNLLLSARLFNTICATVMLGVLFYATSMLFCDAQPLIRFSLSASSVGLILSNPIFIYASGLGWNHDLPVALTLLAVVLLTNSVRRTHIAGRIFVVGVLVGSAIDTRLSFAPIIVPFIIGVFLLPATVQMRQKLLQIGAFLLGACVALVPSFTLFALAPTRFIFGNWGYHQLNEMYWQQMAYTRAMTLPGKLSYLGEVISEPATLILAASLLLVTIVTLIKVWRANWTGRFSFIFTFSLVPFLLIGVLAPEPTWYQYYYALVPLFVLALAQGVASFGSNGRVRVWALSMFALVALLSGVAAIPVYLRLNISLSVADWEPNRIHSVGAEIKHSVSEGKVLTLSPLLPLEGGAGIYEELATGPFGWRVANLFSSQERQELGIVSADDLDTLLRDRPPRGILVGLEPGLEDRMVQYAERNGYIPETLSNGAILWVAPLP